MQKDSNIVVAETRPNRATGSIVCLLDNRNGALDSGAVDQETGEWTAGAADPRMRWFGVCDTHGTYVFHRTRKQATEWLAWPQDWCDQCSSTAPPEAGSAED